MREATKKSASLSGSDHFEGGGGSKAWTTKEKDGFLKTF